MRWHGHLLQRMLKVQPRQAPWTVALRNTIGVVLPLVCGILLGNPQAGLGMTIGALTVMFSDQPGTYAVRFRRLLLASCGGALAALTGFTLGGETAVILPVLAVWTFVAGLLVALGAPATRVGLTSIIVLLIASSRADPGTAIQASLLIFAGGGVQALLAVLLWPMDRDRPQRQMLAEAFQALAATVRDLKAGDEPPPASSTINDLQTALLDQRPQRNLIQERIHILVHEYDQIRLSLVALSELLHGLEDKQAQALRAWCARAAETLEAAAGAMLGLPGRATPNVAKRIMDAELKALHKRAQSESAKLHTRLLLQSATTLARHIRVVARNCQVRWGSDTQGSVEAMQHLPRVLQASRPIDILRANLSWHATAFRHALRCAIAVTAGLAIARFTGMEHGYWIAMTAAIVLKPDFGATISYGLLRMLGTLAGLLLMSFLLDTVLGPLWLRVVALAVLCFSFREMAPRHYGIGVAALSGMLVLMLALAGEPAMQLVVARATGTVGGCLLGLAAYLAWPSWERSRVRPALADMLEAWSAYLQSLRDDDTQRHGDARRAARTARSNAQASMARLREEPRTGEGLLANGEAFLITGNRLARASISLDAVLMQRPPLRSHPELQNFLDLLAGHMKQQAARMNNFQTGPVPDCPIASCAATLREELDRAADDSGLAEIVERLETIAAALDTIMNQLKKTT